MECANCAIACIPSALTADERARAGELREQFAASITSITEVDDGYVYHYRGDAELFRATAEWVALERRCCPFLSFALRWDAHAPSPQLHLRGPSGVKAFLNAELPVMGRMA